MRTSEGYEVPHTIPGICTRCDILIFWEDGSVAIVHPVDETATRKVNLHKTALRSVRASNGEDGLYHTC